jgi:acetylornithine/LysW-gamma-L-lysine aminotransferase
MSDQISGTDSIYAVRTSTQIYDIEDAHTSGAYTKRPLVIVRGEGCTVWDADGNAYLDASSGQGVALLGHAHPAVAQAVSAQAATLITCAEAFYNDRRAELYGILQGLLSPLTPNPSPSLKVGEGLNATPDTSQPVDGNAPLAPLEVWRFFLCNSGAEATEAALKVARLLTNRTRIVATMRGFHGRTLGALGATFNKDYRAPFEGWMPPTTHIPYNDLAAAEAALTEDVAAFIIEPAQGEGGVHLIDADYLRGLRELCTARGVMLICDEIQSGLGRCGRWFAFEHAGIVPDIVTMGKGIAGGVPMGVTAWRGALGTIPAATHGSTFGGNPLSCAAAIASLIALREIDAPARSADLGAWFVDQLRGLNLPAVREIRGQGLMIGIELRGRVTPILQALQARGILGLPAGKTVLRFLPPLIITQAELQRVVEAVRDILSE